MVVVTGVKPVKGFLEGYKLVLLPYMELEVIRYDRKLSKRFWVDIFFIDKLDLPCRRALLLRKPVDNTENVEVPEESLLKPAGLTPAKLYELLYEAYRFSRNILDSYYSNVTKKLAKLWRLRTIIPPVGRVASPEDKKINEAAWAVAILGEALLIGKGEEKGVTNVTGRGVFWWPFYLRREGEKIKVLNGGSKKLDVDVRYTSLLGIDQKAREALEKTVKF